MCILRCFYWRRVALLVFDMHMRTFGYLLRLCWGAQASEDLWKSPSLYSLERWLQLIGLTVQSSAEFYRVAWHSRPLWFYGSNVCCWMGDSCGYHRSVVWILLISYIISLFCVILNSGINFPNSYLNFKFNLKFKSEFGTWIPRNSNKYLWYSWGIRTFIYYINSALACSTKQLYEQLHFKQSETCTSTPLHSKLKYMWRTLPGSCPLGVFDALTAAWIDFQLMLKQKS